MDFVGQYKTKQSEAAAARKKADALAKMGLDMSGEAINTGGFEYMSPEGGTMSAPGYTQVNYGDAIGKLGAAFMGRGAEKDATSAEDAAKTAQMEALKNVLGNGSALTPESVMQAEQLGMTPAMMKLVIPEKPSVGAVTQGAATPAGRAALVAMGAITQEQADQMGAAADAGSAAEAKAAQEAYLFEQQNKKFAPQVPRGMTMAQFAQSDPEGYRAMKDAEAQAALQGKAPVLSPYDTQFQKDQAKIDAKVLEGSGKIDGAITTAAQYLGRQKATPYDGTKYRAMDDAAKVVGVDAVPSSYNTEVQSQLQDAKQFHLNAMEQMRGYGQVTESEQAIIAATQFDIYDSAQARQKKLETIEKQLQIAKTKIDAAKARVGSRSAYGPQAAPAGPKNAADMTDAEIDAELNGP